MNTLRKSLRRKCREKEPCSEFQEGVSRFQGETRRRESIRVKKNRLKADSSIQFQIDKEKILIEGTTKLLAASQNTIQRMEAEKTLILSKTRLEFLSSELHKVRPLSTGSSPAPLAEVSISDIRIPLRWNPFDLLNETGDSEKYGVFAIVSCQGQVYDSTLLYPVDNQVTDLIFKDVIVFSGLPADFKLNIRLYSCDLSTYSTKENIFKTMKRKFRGKKLVNSADRTPTFLPFAQTVLSLGDSSERVECSTISLLPEAAVGGGYPSVFGQFCFRLAVKPYCTEEVALQGSLTVSWPESEIMVSDCYVELVNWKVKVWTSLAEYENREEPWKEVRLDADSRVCDDGSRFYIENTDEELAFFTPETQADKSEWLEKLDAGIESYRAWKQAAKTKMVVLSPTVTCSPKYRKLQRKTNSKLMLVYNRISSVNMAKLGTNYYSYL